MQIIDVEAAVLNVQNVIRTHTNTSGPPNIKRTLNNSYYGNSMTKSANQYHLLSQRKGPS